MLGKGGFSRSVVPEDRHKAPLLDRKIDALQGILFLIHVSVMQIFRLYDHAHSLLTPSSRMLPPAAASTGQYQAGFRYRKTQFLAVGDTGTEPFREDALRLRDL